MKPKQQEKTKDATCRPTQDNWQQMNRKQRREMTRKIQSEDIRLEVITLVPIRIWNCEEEKAEHLIA